MDIFDLLRELENCDLPMALCTIVRSSGSTPRKVGSKMVVLANGEEWGAIIGSIGGGALEHHVRKRALAIINENQAQTITVALQHDLAMCCGGEVDVFIETIIKKPVLLIFGAGHIGQALCPLAHNLGFQISIIDERKELTSHQAFINAKIIHDSSYFNINFNTNLLNYFILIATHDHSLDQEIVEKVIDKPIRHLMLVGSQRKFIMTKKRLLSKGFSSEIIARLNCPAGLAIHAQSPQEIAISIAAKLIEVKNAGPHSSSHSSSGQGKPFGLFEGSSADKQ
jgi:xanthine dehydrogenase accessory factor